MREYKYKAIYKDKWIYFTIDDLLQIDQESMTDKDYAIINHDPSTRCLYIGKKDANDKEIYEGDIVEWEDFAIEDEIKQTYKKSVKGHKKDKRYGENWGEYKIRDVVTMNRFPGFWLKEEEFGFEGEDLISVEKCQVIGNVLENPELLEKK